MRFLVIGAAVTAGLYLLAAAVLFLGQRSMIFPAPTHAVPLPAGFEEVAITTADGLTLRAAYRQAPKGRPTVVFFHGNGDNWNGGSVATARLAEAGYGVLLPEYRGYSGNPGKPTEDGLYKDGRAAIAWLRAQGVTGDQLVLIGNSVGSGVAVQMAVETVPAALILLSPFESLVALAGEKFRWFPGRWLVRDRFDNAGKIGRVRAPVLILHGNSDSLIPVSHAHRLAAASPTAKLILLDGVGHELAYEDGAQAAVVRWLDELSK